MTIPADMPERPEQLSLADCYNILIVAVLRNCSREQAAGLYWDGKEVDRIKKIVDQMALANPGEFRALERQYHVDHKYGRMLRRKSQ